MATFTHIQNQTRPDLDDTVSIASGTTSTQIDLLGRTLVGIITPASLSSTEITFKTSDSEGGTDYLVTDKDNATYTLTTDSTAKYHYLDPIVFAGVRFLKLETGSSETSKSFIIVSRPV